MTALAPELPAVAVSSPDIQVLDPTVFGDWDRLVATHPGATFFHGRAWASTLVNTYQFKCLYVAALAQKKLVALLPMMEARSWIKGTRAVCLPFTDACSALTSREVPVSSILQVAAREAAYRRCRHLEFCGELDSISGESAPPTYYVHKLPLEGGVQSLFDRCESSVRRAIRKAERFGVTVRFATDMDSVREYYRLHCRTRTRHGAPPQPLRFFEAIHEYILSRSQGFVALAFYRERPICGAVFFAFNGKAIYKFSASDERYQTLRGPNLVIWRTIEKLVSEGALELNFGRTSLSNTGLRRFKLGWGTEESTIERIRYCFKSRACTAVNDAATGAHTRLFASLPIFVSRWAGNLAYPHLT